jgi:SNF family Na+-dependent transporter
MGSVETIIISFSDAFPIFKKTKRRKMLVNFGTCFVFFLTGITFTFQSGTYWIELMDNYSSSWAVMLVATCECLSFSWFYGYDNLRKDFGLMLGEKTVHSKFFHLWRPLWMFITPLTTIVNFFFLCF